MSLDSPEGDAAAAVTPTTESPEDTVNPAASGGPLSALREAWRTRSWVAPTLLFVLAFGVFSAFSANRVVKQSTDPHFVYLANTFNSMIAAGLGDEEALKRREGKVAFELDRRPPHKNDWASYWELTLKSGEVVKGIWLDKAGNGRFLLLGKDQAMFIGPDEMRGAKRVSRYFVSFPPGPAVLMMPLAAVSGYKVNDVVVTIFFASLNVALVFLLLSLLSVRGRSGRSRSDNLWLTALFGFGSVHLWSAVLGQVWFTALIIGATFTLAYMLCAIDARRPFLAGCFLAMAFATRTPLLFTCIFFYAFLLFPDGKWRRSDWGDAFWRGAVFSLPCVVVGLLLLSMNFARFEQLSEFGHTYLAQGGLGRIQNYGLFNFHFLSKNLSALFTLVPRLQPTAPYVIVSTHGMSILLTTPAFFYLLRPRPRETSVEVFWHRLLWATVVVVAIPHLLYQNTGYEQFGYRFSIDYMPYLIALLAVGGHPITRAFKVAILAGVAVNAFGAVTFKRFTQFYTNEFFP